MAQKIGDDDLIGEMQRLAEELGRPPTVREMNELGDYSHMLYVRQYGSWTDAIEAAGFKPRNSGRRDIPEEELLDGIKKLTQKLGRPPTAPEMKERGEYTPQTYSNRFGSWAGARDKALSEEGES